MMTKSSCEICDVLLFTSSRNWVIKWKRPEPDLPHASSIHRAMQKKKKTRVLFMLSTSVCIILLNAAFQLHAMRHIIMSCHHWHHYEPTFGSAEWTIATGWYCITKCDSSVYYKVQQVVFQSVISVITKCSRYYKVRQVLLQCVTGIAKCDIITKCDGTTYLEAGLPTWEGDKIKTWSYWTLSGFSIRPGGWW